MLNAKTFAAVAGFVGSTAAHMLMNTPSAFSGTINSPLDATGSNFPCQIGSGASVAGTTNTYALGSNQTLSLLGEAVHGGGSCQISITYDTNPTASSVWKVIHTIQGGCPARDTTGNLADDSSATAPDPFTYAYTIPDNIPTGSGTIAFSWLNRIGNLEFYMNCGILELTGTSGDKSNFDALPDLFVANIESVNSCSTGPMRNTNPPSDPLIPNPGSSVEYNTDWPSLEFDASTCPPAAAAGAYASGGSSGGSASSSAAAPAATQATTAVSSAAATSPTGQVFVTVPGVGTTTAAAAQTTSKVASSAAAATTAAAASGGSSGGTTTSSSSSGALSGACTDDGMFNCIGGDSYQQCASGTWSVVMALAAGTSCTEGQSTDLAIAAISSKRRRRGRAFRA
ncbi:hypothetical protein BX600DRAFT_441219 [Xylariales sp. PMI_506]|nr:hypothetical protein BX600DRAFT_441219 [Xylariales sp. PMI_506]